MRVYSCYTFNMDKVTMNKTKLFIMSIVCTLCAPPKQTPRPAVAVQEDVTSLDELGSVAGLPKCTVVDWRSVFAERNAAARQMAASSEVASTARHIFTRSTKRGTDIYHQYDSRAIGQFELARLSCIVSEQGMINSLVSTASKDQLTVSSQMNALQAVYNFYLGLEKQSRTAKKKADADKQIARLFDEIKELCGLCEGARTSYVETLNKKYALYEGIKDISQIQKDSSSALKAVDQEAAGHHNALLASSKELENKIENLKIKIIERAKFFIPKLERLGIHTIQGIEQAGVAFDWSESVKVTAAPKALEEAGAAVAEVEVAPAKHAQTAQAQVPAAFDSHELDDVMQRYSRQSKSGKSAAPTPKAQPTPTPKAQPKHKRK